MAYIDIILFVGGQCAGGIQMAHGYNGDVLPGVGFAGGGGFLEVSFNAQSDLFTTLLC